MTGFALSCTAGRRPPDGPAQGPARRYDARTFYQTVRTVGASFSADGKRILVSSDATGVFNAYTIPVAGGPPTPVTTSTGDAIFAAAFFPADDRILLEGDRGGNELSHVHVVERDGTRRDLTPGDDIKASFLRFSSDGERFFVLTNERRPEVMDVYEYATADYGRRLLFENEAGDRVVGVSPDGRYVAVSQAPSNVRADLSIWDARAPDAPPRRITPADVDVYHQFGAFTPDGARILYLTNQHGEFYEVWAYDLATGEHEPVVRCGWDIELVSFSPSGRYRVSVANRDARGAVDVVDTTTGEPVPLPPLPAGEIRHVVFAPDERHVAIYASSDTSPLELLVWEVGTRTVRRLTRALAEEVDAGDLVAGVSVRYPSFDGLEIPAILYRPHGATAARRVPAIVWVHGGPGGQSRFGWSSLTQFVVNHGYAVLAVNHRGSAGYGKTFLHLDDRRQGTVDLADCVAAHGYLRNLEFIDGDRIAIAGMSFGGYMTVAALAFHPDVFAAGIDLFGPTNMVRTMESIPPHWAWLRRELVAEYGDPDVPEDRARLRAISPLFAADGIRRPLLVVQGANDPRVLRAESDEIVSALRANAVPVEYVVFDDEGHGFVKRENAIVAAERLLAFLERHLR